ncbi:MAG: hypothetical protein JNK25_02125 [Phycisphaerae bacterium]|nr:hypothetical protein [Phycisphaerae bacterium]
MMNRDTTPEPYEWSDFDLEAFLDDELPAHSASALSRDLMECPGLRGRLASIARTDSAVKAAFSGSAGPSATLRRKTGRIAWVRVLALAASLGLAALGAWRLSNVEPHSSETRSAGVTENAVPPSASGEWIVLSLDLRGTAPERTVRALKADNQPPARRLPPPRWVGPAPLSTAELERRLAAMPGAIEQLDACVGWASERRQSPAIFERIVALAQEPEVRGAALGALRELALHPGLRAYAVASERRIEHADRPSRI